MNTHAITVAITIKNTDSNASFSSVTAATEPYRFSDNCCSEQNRLLLFSSGGGEGRRGIPQNILRALCATIRPDHFKFASYRPEWSGFQKVAVLLLLSLAMLIAAADVHFNTRPCFIVPRFGKSLKSLGWKKIG